MFVGTPKENNYLTTLEKMGLFEVVKYWFGKDEKELSKKIYEKSKDENYFNCVLNHLADYGLAFKTDQNTKPDDLLSSLWVLVDRSGYHPRKYSILFLGKTIRSKYLKMKSIDKFVKKTKLNKLLTENRGVYLKKFKKDDIEGYYLLKKGLKFDKDERKFLGLM